MTSQALLCHLQQAGCLFSVIGSELEIDAPHDILTDKLIAELQAHKPALLGLLRQPKRRYTLADRVVVIRTANAVTECWLCWGDNKVVKLARGAGGLLHCPECNWRFVIEASATREAGQ
jgi:hypothetical protein